MNADVINTQLLSNRLHFVESYTNLEYVWAQAQSLVDKGSGRGESTDKCDWGGHRSARLTNKQHADTLFTDDASNVQKHDVPLPHITRLVADLSSTLLHWLASYQLRQIARIFDRSTSTCQTAVQTADRWLKWGAGGLSTPAPIWAPCNSMSPLIESIKCYFMPK